MNTRYRTNNYLSGGSADRIQLGSGGGGATSSK